MTPGEQKLLRFIERYMAENEGRSPSLVEMAAGIGFASRSSAHRLVERLEAQGRIRRTGRVRSIEIVGLPAQMIAFSDEALLGEVERRGLLRGAA